jgi:hypothetical protein
MKIETIGKDVILTMRIMEMVRQRQIKETKKQQRRNKIKCLLEKVIRPGLLIAKFMGKTTTTYSVNP